MTPILPIALMALSVQSTGSVQQTFAAMDADVSGTVTEAAFIAVMGAGSEAQFAEVAGDDAELTLEELETYMASLEAPEPEYKTE